MNNFVSILVLICLKPPYMSRLLAVKYCLLHGCISRATFPPRLGTGMISLFLAVASANGAPLEAHRHQPFVPKEKAHMPHQASQHLIKFWL